jgi:hypothetical protein
MSDSNPERPARPASVFMECGCELKVWWNVPSNGKPIGCAFTAIVPCSSHAEVETRKTKSYEEAYQDIHRLLTSEFVG